MQISILFIINFNQIIIDFIVLNWMELHMNVELFKGKL